MAELTWGSDAVDSEPFTLRGAGGAPIDGFHARPEGPVRSGIVVHPDIGGLRPLFEDLARRLASHGFAVAVFEPFGRLPADERAAMNLDARMEAVRGLVASEQLGDMTSAADELVGRARHVTELFRVDQAPDGLHASVEVHRRALVGGQPAEWLEHGNRETVTREATRQVFE